MCRTGRTRWQKSELLLDLAGEGVQDISETLVVAPAPADGDGGGDDAPAGDEITRSLVALNQYFEPRVNVTSEREVYRRTDMVEGKFVAMLVTRLGRLAVSCASVESARPVQSGRDN